MARAPRDHADRPNIVGAASEEEISRLVAAIEGAAIVETGGTPVEINPDRLVWLFTGPEGYVPRGSLIIVCRAPGFRRAGVEHPAVAVYPFEHFTAEQIKAMEREPMLQLIGVGRG